MKINNTIITLLLIVSTNICFAQKKYTLESPDKNIRVEITADKDVLKYSVTHNGTVVTNNSPITMTLDNGTILGEKPIVKSYKTTSNDKLIKSNFYKKEFVEDYYNGITLFMRGSYDVQFRAYDDGVAYRFCTRIPNSQIIISEEKITYNFADNHVVYIPYVNAGKSDEKDVIKKQFFNSFENTYDITFMSDIDTNRLAFLPILIAFDNGKKVVITESNVEDYPGTYLRKGQGNSLVGVQASYPKKEVTICYRIW